MKQGEPMKYYYTIGEVSNLIGVKPYVIRYWETEFPSLKPRKGAGRIRKYDEDHILLLKKIKYMLYEQRFTIEGARQRLRSEKRPGEQIELDFLKSDAPADDPNRQTEQETSITAENPELIKQLTSLKAVLLNLKTRYQEYLTSQETNK